MMRGERESSSVQGVSVTSLDPVKALITRSGMRPAACNRAEVYRHLRLLSPSSLSHPGTHATLANIQSASSLSDMVLKWLRRPWARQGPCASPTTILDAQTPCHLRTDR